MKEGIKITTMVILLFLGTITGRELVKITETGHWAYDPIISITPVVIAWILGNIIAKLIDKTTERENRRS